MKYVSLHGISVDNQPLFAKAIASLRPSGRPLTFLAGRTNQSLLSLPAAWSGRRVLWVNFPEERLNTGGFFGWLYRLSARRSEVIVFSEEAKGALAITPQAVHCLVPGSLEERAADQHDLFKALAGHRHHRFVIGTVIKNLNKADIERLLAALVIGLSVCSALELVIIGEGENRKALQWLLRKMNVANRVWLVGSAAPASKFLEHIDVYVMAQPRPGLEEMSDLITAMRHGVPVLAPMDAGLGGIVTKKTGALVDIGNPETLAQQLLRLQQDESLRRALGIEAKQAAASLTFDHFVQQLQDIIS